MSYDLSMMSRVGERMFLNRTATAINVSGPMLSAHSAL